MKIKITESQYKRIVKEEYGVFENDPKIWYNKLLKLVGDDGSILNIENGLNKVIVYDIEDNCLGYYDKGKKEGFIYTEYNGDEFEQIDEQDSEGGDSQSTSSSSVWPLTDVNRGVANTIDNSSHYSSGPHPLSSPWEDKVKRGPSNTLN